MAASSSIWRPSIVRPRRRSIGVRAGAHRRRKAGERTEKVSMVLFDQYLRCLKGAGGRDRSYLQHLQRAIRRDRLSGYASRAACRSRYGRQQYRGDVHASLRPYRRHGPRGRAVIDLRQLLEIEMEGLAADVERVERRKATIAGLHTVLAALPVLQDEDAWISTSDIAKQWRVSKSLVHKRLARSRLVDHPIPSRTVGGEKYVLRSYIAPILAAWCPTRGHAVVHAEDKDRLRTIGQIRCRQSLPGDQSMSDLERAKAEGAKAEREPHHRDHVEPGGETEPRARKRTRVPAGEAGGRGDRHAPGFRVSSPGEPADDGWAAVAEKLNAQAGHTKAAAAADADDPWIRRGHQTQRRDRPMKRALPPPATDDCGRSSARPDRRDLSRRRRHRDRNRRCRASGRRCRDHHRPAQPPTVRQSSPPARAATSTLTTKAWPKPHSPVTKLTS